MLNRFVSLIKEGEIVAFPTETVYGLGADAWNPEAIQKVFQKKGRPADNPLIVHVSSVMMAEEFAKEISDDAKKLIQNFWPGPLTLIFKKKAEVPDVLTAGMPTVAIRWPRHPLSQELIAQAGPLVAPSANTSGKPSPTRPEHVKEDFGEDFPVIEAGETDIGLESAVLDVSKEPYKIYRPGGISREKIEAVLGRSIEVADSSNEAAEKSPGTKYTHYAPKAEVKWLEGKADDPDTLYLFHSRMPELKTDNIIQYEGDYRQMARELYDRFRQADHDGYKRIAIEPFDDVTEKEMIPALKNRIKKALTK